MRELAGEEGRQIEVYGRKLRGSEREVREVTGGLGKKLRDMEIT